MTTRRSFLALLFGIPAAPLAAPRPRRDARRYVLNDCFIAGFRYHHGPSLLGEIRVGSKLSVVAEPTNLHDRNAVRVELGGRHIGYLPRDQNRTVADLLARGAPIACSVTEVSASAEPWEAVRIQTSIAAVA